MNMQTLITTWNKLQHKDAADWLAVSQTREEKKQQVQTRQVAQPIEEQTRATHSHHVVFTHADLGHNPEEKSQIQELYSELNRVAFAPRLAMG